MLSMDNKKGMSEGGGGIIFSILKKIQKYKNKKAPKFVYG
jgi:hypothetical protein